MPSRFTKDTKSLNIDVNYEMLIESTMSLR